MEIGKRIGDILFRASRSIIAYDRTLILKRDLNYPIEWLEASIPVDFRVASLQDMDLLTEEHGYDEVGKEKARKRISEGQLCTIGMHEGEIVCLGRIDFKEFECCGVELPLGPGWAYFYDVRTVMRFRGKGLQKSLIPYRLATARDMGTKCMITWIKSRNGISFRNTSRSGGQVIGGLRSVLLLRKWRISRVSKQLKAYLMEQPENIEMTSATPMEASKAL